MYERLRLSLGFLFFVLTVIVLISVVPSAQSQNDESDERAFAAQQSRNLLFLGGDSGEVKNFLSSSEFQNNIAPIIRLHFAYFDRAPDHSSLIHWINRYANGEDLADISQAFANSPEFHASYQTLDNTDFASLILKKFLDRSAEAEEISNLTRHLEQGMSRSEVMLAFSESEAYREQSSPHVLASMIYLIQLRQPPGQEELDSLIDSLVQSGFIASQTTDQSSSTLTPRSLKTSTVFAETEIARLAADLAPGQFALLQSELPAGYSKLHYFLQVDTGDGHQYEIHEWSDSAHWDPIRKTAFYVGMRVNKKFIAYDAAANRWEELGWAGDMVTREPFGHIYGRNALDWERGHYYHRTSSTGLYRYHIDEQRWYRMPDLPSSEQFLAIESMDWHRGMDMLIVLDRSGSGYKLLGFDGEAWLDLGKSTVHGYHSHVQYNDVRGDMMLAGGNDSPYKVQILTADGSLRSMADAPISMNIRVNNLTYDPISGNYLYMRPDERDLWEYNPDRDEWRLAVDWSGGNWPFGQYGAILPIPIPELGVNLWLHENGPQLYRHDGVFKDVAESPLQPASQPLPKTLLQRSSDLIYHLEPERTFDGNRLSPGGLDASPEVTLAAWVNPGSASNSQARIISKATSIEEADHWWMLSAMDGQRLRFRLKTGGSTTTLLSAAGLLQTDRWQHVAATYDGQRMRLYLNGVEVASAPKTGPVDTNPSVAVAIGNQPDRAGEKPFHGQMRDIRIYKRGLTANEIGALRDGLPPAEPEPEPEPEPIPTTEFSPGDRVTVSSTGNINVRQTAGLSGSIVGTQAPGALGTILDFAPVSADGYVWVRVDFDSGADGWVADAFLAAYSAPEPTPAPTLTLSANPTSITQEQSSTLSWSTTNATSCTASGGWSGTKAVSGTQSVTPATSTTYTLSCTGVGGGVNRSVNVVVESGDGGSHPLDTLQPGHWYEVPNSRMETVFPNPMPQGHARYVMEAWGGGAYDTKRDRLIVWGGGHADYAGNELYVFDIDTLQWARLTEPSCINSCPKNVTYYPDGRPSSSHTYNSLQYMESVDRFVQSGQAAVWGDGNYGSNATHLFNFDTNEWERGTDRPSIGHTIGTITAYDPVTGYLWAHGDSNGNPRLASYDPVADTWTVHTGSNSANLTIYSTAAIAPDRRLMVTVGGYGSTRQIFAWNLNNPSAGPFIPNTTGDRTLETGSSAGFQYDPTIRKFVGWDGGTSIYVLDPDTWHWTKVDAAPSNTVSSITAERLGTYGRFRYIPSRNAYVVVNRTNGNVFFYKLDPAAVGGGTTTPAPTLTFSANPTTITQGQSSTLSWSTQNASSCTASGGWSGTKATSGTQAVTPSVNTTYNLSCTGEGGSVNRSVSVAVSTGTTPPPTGAHVTSFDLTSGTSGTLPFTVGLGFAKGDVSTPAMDIPDGQVIVKRRWNDGSVKHAIASGHVTLSANTPKTIDVLDSTSSGGADLTADAIRTANPQATVNLGSYGNVSLSNLLSNPVRTWINGPEMVEAHYRSTVGSDASFVVWFHVRHYKSGRTWVRAIVENGTLIGTDTNRSYTANVTIGTTSVFNQSLTHYAHTRWSAEGWIGGDPQIVPRHDTQYLIDSKLVPNYAHRNPSATTLNALNQTYTPLTSGNHTASMGNAGFQPAIGLLPNWEALYVTSGAPQAYRATLANSSSYNSFPIVWRDAATGLVPKPSDHPTFVIRGGTYNYGAGNLTWEMNHAPSAGYLAYLVSGDYWHYETMLMNATMNYFTLNTNRGTGVNKVLTAETRGTAWNLRTLAQLAGLAPEGDAVASEYIALMAHNADYFKQVKDNLGGQGIGYLYEYSADLYGPGLVAPWQQHFFIQSLGMGSDLEPLADMTAFNEVRDWLYRGSVGILGDASGYCFNHASSYNIKTSDGGSNNPANWYPNWATVFLNTHGTAPCDNTLKGGSGGAPSAAATGYWGNLLPAIAYAVDHGAPGAQAAWNRLTGATNWSTVDTSGFDDTPVWGVYPRSEE